MTDVQETPVPMRLPCPSCGELHVDEGEFITKPHHTHACQTCGMVWRPALIATVGVRFLPGYLDRPEAVQPGHRPPHPRCLRGPHDGDCNTTCFERGQQEDGAEDGAVS